MYYNFGEFNELRLLFHLCELCLHLCILLRILYLSRINHPCGVLWLDLSRVDHPCGVLGLYTTKKGQICGGYFPSVGAVLTAPMSLRRSNLPPAILTRKRCVGAERGNAVAPLEPPLRVGADVGADRPAAKFFFFLRKRHGGGYDDRHVIFF